MASKPDDEPSGEHDISARRAAPASPGVAHLYQEPTVDDWRLLEEAEGCLDFIERRLRYCVRRVREHVTSGYTATFSEEDRLTPEMVSEHREHAQELVAHLRTIRALLRGADDDARFGERTLVGTVEDASPEDRHFLAMLASVRLEESKGTRQDFDVETLDGCVCAVYAVAEAEMSPDTFKRLTAPRVRENIKLAVSYRGGFVRPPGRRTSTAPRWLEPLYLAALEAGLVPGEPREPGGWYQSLLKRGFLTKGKGKPRG